MTVRLELTLLLIPVSQMDQCVYIYVCLLMSESCISCLEMNVYVLFIIDRESDIENGDNSYGYYGKSWCLIHLIQFKENIEHHTCSESYFSCFFASLEQ